jgi:hypothetical protein
MREEWERQNSPEEDHDRIIVEYIGENHGRALYRVKTDYTIPQPGEV